MYKVLIVDDEEVFCRGLSKLIDWKQYGFEVTDYVLSGMEAIEKVANGSKYDLIITDLVMPDIDGIELIKELRKIKYDAHVIIISGYKDFEYAQQAIEYGVKSYVLKPVNEEYIVKLLCDIKNEIEKEPKYYIRSSEYYSKEKTQVEMILQYTREHCCEEINLATVSKKYFMNTAYLGRLLKSKTGMKLSDFIHDCRVDLAVEMLENSELLIGEISQKVGYKDLNYFNKIFKEKKLISPSDYRRKYKKG
jgi:Response regulator containing CheY-like receiver domain and AraC-type DNA-binding domain